MIIRIDDWEFEVVQVRARKAESFGKPFTSIASITVADGIPHVEGLLSVNKFTRQDYKTFDKFIRQFDFKKAVYSKHNNLNERVRVTKVE